ncbi:MAG: hypothetical protein AAF846_16455 [Chloroflexota bacterium]
MSLPRKNIQFILLASGFVFLAIYVLFVYTWVGAIGALVAASAMSAITLFFGFISYSLQYQRTKSALANKQKVSDTMDTHQTRTIEIDISLESAFDLALNALMMLDDENIPHTLTGILSTQRLKIHEQNRAIGRIRAGLRAKTLGIQDVMDFSRVEIQLQQINKTTTRIQIDSRPTSSLETLDLGRHTHYVSQLALQIRQLAHEQTAHNRLSDLDKVDDNHLIDTDDGHISSDVSD